MELDCGETSGKMEPMKVAESSPRLAQADILPRDGEQDAQDERKFWGRYSPVKEQFGVPIIYGSL